MSTMIQGDRAAAYGSRLSAVRERMKAAGLDLLVAYGSGRHSFLEMNSVWYLSGFKQIGSDAAVLLPVTGDPVLVATPSWDRPRAYGYLSGIGEVIIGDDFTQGASEAIARHNWTGAKAGLAGSERLPAEAAEALRLMFRHPLDAADDTVVEVAKVRDRWALQQAQRATEIAELGYRHLLEIARPGLLEYELSAELECYMRELGADDNFQLVSGSQHNLAVHAPSDRRLDNGDIILGEISPSVEGEFTQICRTFILGQPSTVLLEKYALLTKTLNIGMEAAVPGERVSTVVARMNSFMADHGYGEYSRPPYLRTRGHAMGLGAIVPRDLSEESDTVLEAGMIFVLHPNQYIPETGYLLCGEPVVVEPGGARPLTKRTATLDSVG